MSAYVTACMHVCVCTYNIYAEKAESVYVCVCVCAC